MLEENDVRVMIFCEKIGNSSMVYLQTKQGDVYLLDTFFVSQDLENNLLCLNQVRSQADLPDHVTLLGEWEADGDDSDTYSFIKHYTSQSFKLLDPSIQWYLASLSKNQADLVDLDWKALANKYHAFLVFHLVVDDGKVDEYYKEIEPVLKRYHQVCNTKSYLIALYAKFYRTEQESHDKEAEPLLPLLIFKQVRKNVQM